MKKLPQFLQTMAEMPYMALWHKILINALELNVFEDLVEPKTPVELANIRGWNVANTEIYLQALYALGYLTKRENSYENIEETNRYLLKDGREYAGTTITLNGQDLFGTFPDDFSEILKRGPLTPEEIMKFQENQMDFSSLEESMRKYQMGYSFKEIRQILEEQEEFFTTKKMLDLGCGVGMIGLELAKVNQEMEVILYDMPPMGDSIKRSIEITGMEDRARLLTGNYLQDDIGSGYDLILSSSSIYSAKGNLESFLKKLYDALNPGGIFICICDGVEMDYSGPWDMILAWMVYRMNGIDLSMKKDEVKEAGLKAGFVSKDKQTLQFIGGHMDVDVMKKIS